MTKNETPAGFSGEGHEVDPLSKPISDDDTHTNTAQQACDAASALPWAAEPLDYPPQLTEAQALLFDQDEYRALTSHEIDWLLAAGASIRSIAVPRAVGVATVTFSTGCDRYIPSALGEIAFIFAVIEGGEVIDLAAWAPVSGRIGTRLGVASCLGQGQIGADGRGTTGRPLPVYRDPVGWLRASRHGVVIASRESAAHCLAGVNLRAEDDEHAAELEWTLSLPAPSIIARDGQHD